MMSPSDVWALAYAASLVGHGGTTVADQSVRARQNADAAVAQFSDTFKPEETAKPSKK